MNFVVVIAYLSLLPFLQQKVHANKNSRADSISTIVSNREDIREGLFRYFYDNAVPNPCKTVLFLGVGTAMSVDDYDNLSTLIVDGNEIMAVVIDHNPKWFVKLSWRKFASLYNTIVSSLHQIIPVCEGKRNDLILLGAHSASGQAAVEALPNLTRTPDGFIGLDPYKITTTSTHHEDATMQVDESIPTLNWGFARTTCGVNIDQAAKALYRMTNRKHRVFFRVNNTENSTNHGVAHCIFTDKGCGIICGTKGKGDWILLAVAHSIHLFVDSVQGNFFDKETFILPEEIVDSSAIDLFMNEDDPDSKSKVQLALIS
mmetsp:Transcript_11469/g.21449  ORF Transcript_11469/g.21449 Transcript_11469/m.21449 type:complete len:316 (-) Transcript_11469:2313-3260(-)